MDIETHRIVVPHAARYATLGRLRADLADVVFLCHGYGQLASEFLGLARALENPSRLLVAPEGLSRFYLEGRERVGASWMTREDRLEEMNDYVRYLDLVHEQVFAVVERSAVTLRVLGFSQGGATAARWAVRGTARIDHLVLWGSTLPPELDVESLRSMRVSLVGGSRDPFLEEENVREQNERLARHGVAFDAHRFEGGHRLDDDTLKRVVSNG